MENKITTFTTLVKEEICLLELNKEEQLSLLSGYCKVNGILNLIGPTLTLRTENSKVAKLIFTLFKSLFSVIPSFTYSRKVNFDKGSVFQISINDNVMEILEKLELFSDGLPSNPHSLVLEERLRYFFAGAFLASGSVNSPSSKNYHLQMVVFNEDDAHYFLKLLNRFRNNKAMDFKALPRRNRYVLYLKKADQIATFLSIIYSHDCLLEFENARIEKDYFNSENRIQVCYNANYQKSLAKGEQQAKEIEYLKKVGVYDLFLEKEKIVADIRLANLDYSLNQIANCLKDEYQIVLSKSGVNHILNKFHEKYQELVNE